MDYEIAPEWRIRTSNPGEVTVFTRTGGSYTHREEINRGAPERPLSEEEIIAKFRANTLPAVSKEHADRILDMVLGLAAVKDAKQLSALLAV